MTLAAQWTPEQREIITAKPGARLVVEAAPGTGKTAVAAARVAWLLTETSTNASQILVVSFTRTAVREIRDRIASLANESPSVGHVKITTIDSHSWGLRNGFEDAEMQVLGPAISYHTNLERLVTLFEQRAEGLLQFVSDLEHVIIDEAQDVVGERAVLLKHFLKSLKPTCGATVFADSVQAIYGFTRDSRNGAKGNGKPEPLIGAGGPVSAFERRKLSTLFRACTPAVVELFKYARECVVAAPDDEPSDVERMRATLERYAPRVGSADKPSDSNEDLAGSDDALVLYRYRAEVVRASSFLQGKKIEHRLRLSGLPTVVQPWIGCLLGEVTATSLDRRTFDALWESRVVPYPGLSAPDRDQGWTILGRLAGDRRSCIDLNVLRRVLARSRPPIEVCATEAGTRGPILSTIHASKGREASHVRLVLPKAQNDSDEETDWPEEARVLYVGATRAKGTLELRYSYGARAGPLQDDRMYAAHKKTSSFLQVGIEGDVDPTAHLRWPDAAKHQNFLATMAGGMHLVTAFAKAENDWRYELTDVATGACFGRLSASLSDGLKQRANHYKAKHGGFWLPAREIRNLAVVGMTTVALEEGAAEGLPAPYCKSRLFLAPIVRGYPLVFFNRYEASK